MFNQNIGLSLSQMDGLDLNFTNTKEYLPAFAVLSVGAFGLRNFATSTSSKLLKISYTSLLLLGTLKLIVGSGLLLYNLSFMQTRIQSNTSESIRKYIKRNGWIRKTNAHIASKVRQSLSTTLFPFKSQFYGILGRKREALDDNTVKRDGFMDDISRCETLIRASESLKEKVKLVQLDE